MANTFSTSSYVPDDARITLDSLNFLASQPGLALRTAVLALLTQDGTPHDPSVSDVARLRKSFPTDAVHAALTLAKLQENAHLKFPDLPQDAWLWCVPEALEQATAQPVAHYKARRFLAAGATGIADLCSGIGGDAFSLALIAPTLAVDLSPVRLRCLELNTAQLSPPLPHTLETRAADIRTLLESSTVLPPTSFIHIDPARRSAGNRFVEWADLLPGPDILLALIERFPAVAIKLSPAADFATFPPGHVELISHRRSVVQAVLYTGRFLDTLHPNHRTATVLSTAYPQSERSIGVSECGSIGVDTPIPRHSHTPTPPHPPYSLTALPSPIEQLTPTPQSFIYELDGAITRAQLSQAFLTQNNLQPLTADGCYLTADFPLQHLALQSFSVIATVPYSEKRVAEALRHHAPPNGPTGPIEVKTRGMGAGGLDTDALQKLWTKLSPSALTVLIYRSSTGDRLATLAKRVAPRARYELSVMG